MIKDTLAIRICLTNPFVEMLIFKGDDFASRGKQVNFKLDSDDSKKKLDNGIKTCVNIDMVKFSGRFRSFVTVRGNSVDVHFFDTRRSLWFI